MKKAISILLSLVLVLSMSVVGAYAEAEELRCEVFVTIADQDGNTVVAAQQVVVTDIDSDGKLTVNDALYAAHEEFYDGGAAAGYATSVTEYGPGLTKLWGVANGGSYGYYVNNTSAWSLTDPVKSGDYVAAFIYTDLIGWSDHYSYFDTFSGEFAPGEPITLTYCEAGYDEEWKPVVLPVEGAEITVDGEATGITTDAEGKATVALSDPGVHLVSAVIEGKRLVAPVYVATVTLSADVYVTIADQDGNTAVSAQQITVTDIDSDGKLTVNDTLYAAHEAFYDGGAEAGYAASDTQYGLSLNKLWGCANGGSYGYYVNNISAWSLTDPVKSGDYVAAFVYTDFIGWSDHYSYFERLHYRAIAGQPVVLTVLEASFDEDWNPVTVPVSGAQIVLNGKPISFDTSESGQSCLTVNEPGTYLVSTITEGRRLVTPVCYLEVAAASALIGDADNDGTVTILDATHIQRWLAALVGDSKINLTTADADRSGGVTILDATAIQRFLAGLIKEL